MQDNSKQKVALVTGATGYIGNKMAEKLIREGYKVLSIRHWKKIHENLNITMIDKENIYNNQTKIDVIFHFAALSDNYSNDKDTVLEIIKSNLSLTVELMYYAKERNIPIFIASSYSQYTDTTAYTICKTAAEQFSIPINYKKIAFLRLTDVYGEDDTRGKIFYRLKESIKDNQVFSFRRKASTPINITFVDDVVDGFYHAYTSEQYGIYDLIYEETITTLGEVANTLDPTGKHYTFPPEYEIPTNQNRLDGFNPTRRFSNIKTRKGTNEAENS